MFVGIQIDSGKAFSSGTYYFSDGFIPLYVVLLMFYKKKTRISMFLFEVYIITIIIIIIF